jgi:uncharacterized membrane protein HdeD (DUF308 family)
MIKTLIKNWWLLALRGILAALFSVMAFLMESSAETFTLREFATKGMVAFLGILALTAGACTIAAGVWRFTEGKWWVLVLDGIGISAAGLTIMVSDNITFRTVTYLLIALALAIGVVELAAARMLRRHLPDEWFLGLGGLASIAFGVAFLVTRPEQPASILIWLGAYSGFSAICILGLALRLRSLRVSIHKLAGSEPTGS